MTTITLPENYRLKWSSMSIDLQQETERTNRKTGETHTAWKDIGFYSRTLTGLQQAAKAAVVHYASTHGETAPQELVKVLDAFVDGVAAALARVEKAA